jgi:hypothetical protein
MPPIRIFDPSIGDRVLDTSNETVASLNVTNNALVNGTLTATVLTFPDGTTQQTSSVNLAAAMAVIFGN